MKGFAPEKNVLEIIERERSVIRSQRVYIYMLLGKGIERYKSKIYNN